MKKLALMGIAAGIISTGTDTLEATQNGNFINLDNVIAKPSCKAHGGCGGTVASRDIESVNLDNEEDDDDDSEEDKTDDNS